MEEAEVEEHQLGNERPGEEEEGEGLEWDGLEEVQEEAERVRERFENEVRNICATIELVVVARRDTIVKLERAADYLDTVWLRCRVGLGNTILIRQYRGIHAIKAFLYGRVNAIKTFLA